MPCGRMLSRCLSLPFELLIYFSSVKLFYFAQPRLTAAYHQILLQGFSRLHNVRPESLKRQFEDSNELMTAAEVILDPVEPGQGGASLFQKALRIKAYKAFCWLNDTETVYNLLVSVACVAPLELVMWKFMTWQEQSMHLSTRDSPLIQMTSSERSPAKQSIRALCNILESGSTFEGGPTLQDIADRLLA